MSISLSQLEKSLDLAIKELDIELTYIELNISIVDRLLLIEGYSTIQFELLNKHLNTLLEAKVEVLETKWLHYQKLQYARGALLLEQAKNSVKH